MPLDSETLIVDQQLRKVPFRQRITLKVATAAKISAIGVMLSAIIPTAYMTLYGAKIDFFAHMINVISGVLLGPWYAILTAFIIAICRYSLKIGTILAFPGGISGPFMVGLMCELILRIDPKKVNFAAFFEPIGTIFIGGTLSAFYHFNSLFTFWWLFAIACIPGTILGWVGLKTLERYGLINNYFDDRHENGSKI